MFGCSLDKRIWVYGRLARGIHWRRDDASWCALGASKRLVSFSWLAKEGGAMASPVVTYELDDETRVRFEVDPTSEWSEVSSEKVLGRIREAVEPAVEGAKAVLDRVREVGPDEIEVKFGIKVSGDMNWLIAKAATEANFEVTLTWTPGTPE